MDNGRFCVLVVEDTPVLVALLRAVFERNLPDALLLDAGSISEARALAATHHVDFFVLDVHLPDGNGIDFLCHAQQTHPNAAAVVMTSDPLHEHRVRAGRLGVVKFFDKPVDVTAVVGFASDYCAVIKRSPGEAEKFHACLSGISPMDIIQLKCLAQTQGAVEFIRPNGMRGRIYFHCGRIIHAECGEFIGVQALNTIVGWQGGRIVEVDVRQEPQPTIHSDWQTLLMNAIHALDESRAPTPGYVSGAGFITRIVQ